MPYSKYRRFLQKELDLDKFIARQLTDTGYITRATVEYLRLLFERKQEHSVLGLKGQLTAELRWQWGLDKILEEMPDSPAWNEKNELRPGEKNRADHRHHAIDAIVVALTNRQRLHKLSELVRRGGAQKHGEVLPEPWPDFRETVVGRIRGLKVSHRVERKVRGALHEETLYGPTPTAGEWVLRKSVELLSAAEVERIRDPKIRQIVLDRLRERGIDFGRGKKPDAKKMKEALSNPPLQMPSGVLIKKVRLIKQELTIQPLRDDDKFQAYVKPGSTHHLCIFEFEERSKKKREAIFVTMLEATKRLKRGEPIVCRTHPERPEAKFIMSLSSREMVLANWRGEQKLLVFKTAASTQGQLYFAEHTDARRSSDQTRFVATANSLDARKVTVDPLGRIRWAND
jgi:CRISPR-associated endonuclease Csn1